VARLQQGLAYKLILVSAPAGYGKTTVLCEWLATWGQPSAWISLDKGDNDPARFWAYLQAALQRATSAIENSIPDILHNYDDAPGLEALLTDLINELDKLQQPLVLVVDDYHNIDTQSIHDGLNMLLEHAPAQFHMVLSTRADPPLPLARFRARSEMMELRQSDLCFTLQEAADFLHHTPHSSKLPMGAQLGLS
jgi:LuxR family maltose regulon positive regulatory protein